MSESAGRALMTLDGQSLVGTQLRGECGITMVPMLQRHSIRDGG